MGSRYSVCFVLLWFSIKLISGVNQHLSSSWSCRAVISGFGCEFVVFLSHCKSTSKRNVCSRSSVKNFPWSWVLPLPHCSARRVKLKLACRVMRRQHHHIWGRSFALALLFLAALQQTLGAMGAEAGEGELVSVQRAGCCGNEERISTVQYFHASQLREQS